MDRVSRIGVLLSGRHGERELALRQADVIVSALESMGHEAIPIFVDGELDLLVRQAHIDTAFVALQGRHGSDGCVQGFLELLGIPYTGSGVLATALGSNRKKSKEILRLHNLPTAAGYLYDGDAGEPIFERHGSFGFPVLVRPARGAALGADVLSPHALGAVAHDELDLETCVDEALAGGDEVLIERLQPGRLFSVGLLDGQPFTPIEIEPPEGERDDTAKSKVRPASSARNRLPAERLRSVLRLATAAYDALECSGPANVLIQVSDRGNEIVRDIDVLPVLTPASTLVRSAAASNITLPDLVARILAGARLHAHGKKESRRDVQVRFIGQDRRRGASARAH